MDERNIKFLKTYLMLVIIWALGTVIDTMFVFGKKETVGQVLSTNVVYITLISLFEYAIFILSIIAIVVFIRNKLSQIFLVLPIYHIVAAVFISMYGMIWGVISIAQGIPVTNQTIPPGLVIIAVISSLFELVFSGYILIKFR